MLCGEFLDRFGFIVHEAFILDLQNPYHRDFRNHAFPINIIFMACAKGGQSNKALSLLQVVKDKGLPLDSYCYTAVIDGK